jgi:hypothetical protein
MFRQGTNIGYQAASTAVRTVMSTKTAIYDPPMEGLPYLVITFESDGLKVLTAESLLEARIRVSEKTIRRRTERRGEALKELPSQPT